MTRSTRTPRHCCRSCRTGTRGGARRRRSCPARPLTRWRSPPAAGSAPAARSPRPDAPRATLSWNSPPEALRPRTRWPAYSPDLGITQRRGRNAIAGIRVTLYPVGLELTMLPGTVVTMGWQNNINVAGSLLVLATPAITSSAHKADKSVLEAGEGWHPSQGTPVLVRYPILRQAGAAVRPH